MILHGKALAALLCIAKPEGRYFTDCIHVKPDGTMEATDGGVALSITPMPPAIEDADFPSGKFSVAYESPTRAVQLPRPKVEAALKGVSKKATIPILGHVQLLEYTPEPGRNGVAPVVLRATDLDGRQEVIIEQETRVFPDLARVQPSPERPEVTVHLGIAALESLIKAAKKLNPKMHYMTLHVGREYQTDVDTEIPAHRKATSSNTVMRVELPAVSEGLTVTGLLMPYGPK